MKRSFSAPLFALTVVLCATWSASALAAECDGIGPSGVCLDAQTLQWCAGGELMEATCPEGEICTSHDAFDGDFGCVPVEDSSCGVIAESGACTSGGNLVWCSDQGELILEECPEDTLCAWDEANDGYECLPSDSIMVAESGGAEPPPDADAPGDPEDQPAVDDPVDAGLGDSASADAESDDLGGTGPTPSVRPGAAQGADEGEPSMGSDTGCSSLGAQGRDGLLIQLLAALLMVLFLVRRIQRHDGVLVRRPNPVERTQRPQSRHHDR